MRRRRTSPLHLLPRVGAALQNALQGPGGVELELLAGLAGQDPIPRNRRAVAPVDRLLKITAALVEAPR